jgi:ABC-type transport system substrate-binding protein
MRLVAIAVVVASLLTLAGCSKGGFSDRANSSSPDTLRHPIMELTKLDPAVVFDVPMIETLQNVYQGLVRNGADNQPEGCLAASWTVSPDGRVYTFKLREGVRFHNGALLTAHDVKYSLERAAHPKLMSPTAGAFMSEIIGLKAFNEGKASDIPGIRVVDERTLEVEIDQPRPYFLGRLGGMYAWVMPAGLVPMGQEITEVANMVGTGPFRAVRFEPEQILSLEAFPEHWEGAPRLARIERSQIKDPITRTNKFLQEEADLVDMARADIAAARTNPQLGPSLKTRSLARIGYLAFNLETKPFHDVRVRQAIAHAIDRDRIVKEVLQEPGGRARAILPPGMLGYREDAPDLNFNPERARKLLSDAGYPNGTGFPVHEIAYIDGNSDSKLVAEAIVIELRRTLNVQMGTRAFPYQQHIEMQTRETLPICYTGWGSGSPDPEDVLTTLLASYSSNNCLNYASRSFDELCRQAGTYVGRSDERIKLYQRAEDIALRDAPVIPIAYGIAGHLVGPRVQGLEQGFGGLEPHLRTSLR